MERTVRDDAADLLAEHGWPKARVHAVLSPGESGERHGGEPCEVILFTLESPTGELAYTARLVPQDGDRKVFVRPDWSLAA